MDTTTIIILTVATLITGFSKFSVGGLGILVLPILLFHFNGTEALGILLPIYIFTDIMAVLTYRKHVQWKIIFRVLPLAVVGIGIGFYLLTIVKADDFATLIGVIILAMLILGVWLENRKSTVMQNAKAGYITSLIIGIVSMLANAAGPVLSLYLVDKKLPKDEVVHTRVWTMFLLNLTKIPTLYSLGALNIESFKISLLGLPGLVVGIIVGYVLIRYINFSHLKWLIRAIALLGSLKLLFF